MRAIRSIALLVLITASPASAEYAIAFVKQSGWSLGIETSGSIALLLKSSERSLVPRSLGTAHLSLHTIDAAAERKELCNRPLKSFHLEDGWAFEYFLTTIPIKLVYQIRLIPLGKDVAVKRTVTLLPQDGLNKDLVITVPNPFTAGADPAAVFVPQFNGIGAEQQTAWAAPATTTQPSATGWTWLLDTPLPKGLTDERHLALPMISATWSDPPIRLTHIADPFGSVTFTAGPQPSMEWTYRGSQLPNHEPVTRTFWTVIHAGQPEAAMQAWYDTALADVPSGPAWLHDVAWQHYDYLSYGGRGWFEDIDAAEKLVPREDRSKVIFTIHGWYDLLGRYCFDEKTGRLDDEWTAFPNAPAMKDKSFPTSESVKMTKADMHRRIRYAKDRGFRVCIYFADGLAACEAAKVYAPDQLLNWGGWQGPDTLGKSYMQNPAHPAVYARYVNYFKALLAEYGNEVDAFDWDETFMIRTGATNPKESPQASLPGPAFMRLVREITKEATAFRKDLAFLASDCIGATWDEKKFWLDIPPYAIMAHGCYQDSHSRPSIWPFGLFPNYRNVLWSCNWSSASRFNYTRFGVEHYDTPVATSNGWQDAKGVARLDDAQRAALLKLFNSRKTRAQNLHWLTRLPSTAVAD